MVVDGADPDTQLRRQVAHAHLAIALFGEQGQGQVAVFQIAGRAGGTGFEHGDGPREWHASAL
ncbi:hypothetical protein D9M68_886330 [compost metagenome]